MITHREVRDHLTESIKYTLMNWDPAFSEGSVTTTPTGADRVAESLTAIRSALKALGPTRDRAGARFALEARRDTLAAKHKLYTSMGRWFTGNAAVALIDRYVAAKHASAAAVEAMMLATRATVAARRAELDLAEADEREIAREIDGLKTALAFPASALIDALIVKQARIDTEALSLETRRPVALHMALDQGRDASAALQSLYVCFETDAKCSELYELRADRYLAAHPEAVAA